MPEALALSPEHADALVTLGDLLTILWLGLCLWTWVSPAVFHRRLQKELEPVTLSRDS